MSRILTNKFGFRPLFWFPKTQSVWAGCKHELVKGWVSGISKLNRGNTQRFRKKARFLQRRQNCKFCEDSSVSLSRSLCSSLGLHGRTLPRTYVVFVRNTRGYRSVVFRLSYVRTSASFGTSSQFRLCSKRPFFRTSASKTLIIYYSHDFLS